MAISINGSSALPQKIYTGICTSSAATSEKTVTLDNLTGFSLVTGATAIITFQNGNTATTPTLNINNTGAKTLVVGKSSSEYTTGDGVIDNGWAPYETVICTYNGTQWVHQPSGAFVSQIKENLQEVLETKIDTEDLAIFAQNSPELGGTPIAPTAADGTNTTQIATTAFVQSAISSAITSAIGGSY